METLQIENGSTVVVLGTAGVRYISPQAQTTATKFLTKTKLPFRNRSIFPFDSQGLARTLEYILPITTLRTTNGETNM